MAIDYLAESERYRPAVIETLLVGEAPPPTGKSYFYLPALLRSGLSIRKNCSLPATIFYHYFQKLPETKEQYVAFLSLLKDRGVFLVDLHDEPVKVRNSPDGVSQILAAIPFLRDKLKRRNILVADENIVFLLARTSYRRNLRQEFPKSRLVPWIDFRMNGGDTPPLSAENADEI